MYTKYEKLIWIMEDAIAAESDYLAIKVKSIHSDMPETHIISIKALGEFITNFKNNYDKNGYNKETGMTIISAVMCWERNTVFKINEALNENETYVANPNIQ